MNCSNLRCAKVEELEKEKKEWAEERQRLLKVAQQKGADCAKAQSELKKLQEASKVAADAF